jgi:hypothetical protein
VVGKPLGLLGVAPGSALLDGLGDAGVQGALPDRHHRCDLTSTKSRAHTARV